MWIKFNNLVAKVTKCDVDEFAWIREFLTFRDKTAFFRKGKKAKEGTCLLNKAYKTFPAGLVGKVKEAGERAGFQMNIVDIRTQPCVRDPNANLAWLRDYQSGAVDASCAATRGILKMVTGAGKTEVAIGITRALPCNWLFLVHRAQLLGEAADRYDKRANEHGLTDLGLAGRCGDSIWDPQDRFTVATFQTLAASLNGRGGELLKKAEGIIIDECHTLPADSFWHVAMRAENAYYRIGMSGTPLARGDKRSVFAVGALGRIIYEIKPDLLIKRGVLSRPKIRMMRVIQESEKKTWNGVYSECISNSRIRNRAVLRAAQRAAKPSLVFVKEVKHGEQLEKLFTRNGIKSKFVHGKDKTSQRKNAIKNLQRGELDVLICSVIFQEGVDIPELESVIIASGGKSVIATLQRIGRGMRATDDKKTVEIYDFDDRGNKWLEKHSRARIRSYAQEGHEVVYDGELFS